VVKLVVESWIISFVSVWLCGCAFVPLLEGSVSGLNFENEEWKGNMVSQIFQEWKHWLILGCLVFINLFRHMLETDSYKITFPNRHLKFTHSKLIFEVHLVSEMCRFTEFVSKEKYTHYWIILFSQHYILHSRSVLCAMLLCLVLESFKIGK